ncbi:MAG: HEPN domain-containing protein [Bacteroidales bacterium]|nr:HEPN domain-containing protein [Bacteroidales bacterium]MBN2818958.1 HEPN domain-containing protein [Bacteroidales bacterium]
MNYNKEDLILYRLEKSFTTFEEAKSLSISGFWGGAANRLYYSCFYAVIALLAKDDVQANTHNGVRTEFFKRYIKTGLLDKN